MAEPSPIGGEAYSRAALLVQHVAGEADIDDERLMADAMGRIAAIERNTGPDQIMQILRDLPPSFDVLSGDDNLTFPLMAAGAKGVISVASNVAPRMVSDMVHYMQNGELEKARDLHFRLLPLFKSLFVETNPIPVKTAMRMMKRPSGVFRLPLCDMEPSNAEIVRTALSELRLI